MPLFKTLGWAAYLGCSWTWCIGMFLPTMLLRDFGWLAWVAFMVPNVLGAAAMGFVLSHTHTSERFVARHKPVCMAFSVVTILFQCYFLFWVAAVILPDAKLVLGLLAILLLLYGVSRKQGIRVLLLSCLVFVISVVTLIFFAKTLPFSFEYLHDPVFGTMAPQLRYLIPVFVFGFSLSPYLDLTFHHASQQTASGVTKASFVLGFGLFFFLMSVFTLLYAPSVIALFFGQTETREASFQLANRPALRLLLFVHFALQAGFTAILHHQRLRKQVRVSLQQEFIFVLILGLTAAFLFALGRNQILFGLSGHELIYRAFMAFYGLLAPAYIWICVIPFRTMGVHRQVDRVTYGGAIGLALPLFAWAFFAAEYRALAPGLCLVLAAPLVRACYYRWIQRSI
jgi:hypothetical protein